MTGLTASERAMIAAVDPPTMLDRTLSWAAINSGTANLAGIADMAGRLAEALSVLPGEIVLAAAEPVMRIGADGVEDSLAHGDHLVLRVRPRAGRRVLLTGHMDTVFSADHPFQHCEWLDETTLRGPGTADMKAGLAIMIEGLRLFESTAPALGYDVMINSDEETGSLSSATLIRQLSQAKHAALTYEPSLPGGVMAGARPGSGNFSAVIVGRSAHAGRNPQDGRNAVLAAADLALRLAAGARPGLTVNPARIDGGGPNNMVPERAVLRFNVRPTLPEDQALATVLIEQTSRVVETEHGVSIRLHGSFNRPPKPLTPASERLFALVAAAAGDLGEVLHRQDTGGVCDGNNIAACGVPVLDTMGACGGAIHTPEEFLMAPSLATRAQLTALVLHRLDREITS
jgi:glutamate carboxypeptidase